MKQDFLTFFNDYSINKNAKFLLAVSGGVDSMVLAHLFHNAGMDFGVAHCNFKLRGEESGKDADLVRRYAQTYGVPLHLKEFDTESFSREHAISTQMAARELRYEWFDSLKEEHSYHYLVTAHHHNDSIETILFNLTKGSGISGLRGILPVNGRIIRPFIHLTKEQILEIAVDGAVEWREDASNQSDKYHRNLIRNQVVPLLEKINPSFNETMHSTIRRLWAVENEYKKDLERISKKILIEQVDGFRILKEHLSGLTVPVVFDLLKDFSFNMDQVENIFRHLQSTPGKQFFSKSHVITLDRDCLMINTQQALVPFSREINAHENLIKWDHGILKITNRSGGTEHITSNPDEACIDRDLVKFPLVLRSWEAGDYFFPLGMKGKKKISDFMIDQKIPLNLKSRVLVLCSGKDVVWIVGYRIDNRYKVTEKTREICKVQLEKA